MKTAFCGCKNLNNKSIYSTKRNVQCNCGEEYKIYGWLWDDCIPNQSASLSDDKRDVLFHKTFSTGTGAVRGNEPFNLNLHYYWEIKMLSSLYGTDVMIGVATEDVDVNLWPYRFCSMLGLDEQSWGYSYRGVVQHAGELYRYGPRFDQGTLLGCHLDMCNGTLEYYHNRRPLGVAFTGLKLYARRLYPMVCSTAAQSAIRLTCAMSMEPTLQLAILRELKKKSKDINITLDRTPPGLRTLLQKQYWWLIDSPRTTVEQFSAPCNNRMIICSSDEDTVAIEPISRNHQRKRKRTKNCSVKQDSEKPLSMIAPTSNSTSSSASAAIFILLDGPTSVERLSQREKTGTGRILRSHTNSNCSTSNSNSDHCFTRPTNNRNTAESTIRIAAAHNPMFNL